MEDLKVGEYVRTHDGEIFRIAGMKRYKDRVLFLTNSFGQYSELVMQEIVYKHSKKQKELINEDDIIQYIVNNCKPKIGQVKQYRYTKVDEKYLGVEGFSLEQINILKIMTKEQFEQNCYNTEG